jgi:CBS domain-containing protein
VESIKRDRWPRPLSAAAGATFLLLLGLGVVWFARKVADVQEGAVLTAFVVVPALVYVVLRGDLAELKGPGGWAATFVRVARTKVSAAAQKLVEEEVQIIQKESMQGLIDQIGTLELDRPVLMTMTLGRGYSEADILGYLKTLAPFPRFRLVILLNNSGAFVGCISPGELTGLMRSEGLRDGFLKAVVQGDSRDVLRYPGILNKIQPQDATNAEALAAMTSNNLSAIAILDENRQLRGVAEREQIVSKLVLSLTDATLT